MSGVETTIQILTCSALIGLLGAVGLRLTHAQVKTALVRCRFWAILCVNFILVPLFAAGFACWFGLRRDITVAMILLGTAPFAPVVPVFARMARAELALAAALTGIFPLLSVILTPLAAWAALRLVGNTDALRFNLWSSLGLLAPTVTLPLAAGVFVRQHAPDLGRRWLRPVEMLSEFLGSVSLLFVIATNFGSIVHLGGRAWVAMMIVCELSLVSGWLLGGPEAGTRRVIALGTSNRNIALALLVAIESFPGTDVAAAVVGNGLLLIMLGLVHVACWRIASERHADHSPRRFVG